MKYTDMQKEVLKALSEAMHTVDETQEAIHKVYTETGYVIDTHTAVAASVYDKYLNEIRIPKDCYRVNCQPLQICGKAYSKPFR